MAETTFLIRTQSDRRCRTLVVPARSHVTAAKIATVKFRFKKGETIEVKVRGDVTDEWQEFKVVR